MENTSNTSESVPKKEKKDGKWFFFSFVAILIFLFFAFYASQFTDTSLSLDLSNKSIEINTSNITATDSEVEHLNTNEYYFDSDNGFLFKKPASDWNGPQSISGFYEYFEMKNAVLEVGMMDFIEQMLQANPYGEMLRNVESVRFTYGRPIDFEVTDSTSNDVIEAFISGLSGSDNIDVSEQDIVDFRRSLVGFEEIRFENEFIVSVFDKSLLEGKPIKQSLAGFALSFIASFGQSIDNLVADKSSILVSATLGLNNIKINEEIGNTMFDRLMFLTENEEHFYMVEIAYSPSTESSVKIWSELNDMMKSFKVINQT